MSMQFFLQSAMKGLLSGLCRLKRRKEIHLGLCDAYLTAEVFEDVFSASLLGVLRRGMFAGRWGPACTVWTQGGPPSPPPAPGLGTSKRDPQGLDLGYFIFLGSGKQDTLLTPSNTQRREHQGDGSEP